jgi:hemolysin activation/secretion protein
VCLTEAEAQSVAAAVVKRIRDEGYRGINVHSDDSEHATTGVLRFSIMLVKVSRIEVRDMRTTRRLDEASLKRIKDGFPFKMGDRVRMAPIDEYLSKLKEEVDAHVEIAMTAGETVGDVVVSLLIGPPPAETPSDR